MLDNFQHDFEEYIKLSWNSYLPAIDRLIPILNEMTQLPKGRILDVGSSYGCLCSIASQMGFEVHAVDPFVNISRGIERKYDIRFQNCNMEAEKTPYNDSFFDIAILAHVLDLFNFSPTAPIKEIYRILKKGGYLFVTVPNVACYGNIISLLRGRNIYFHDLQTYINPNPRRVKSIKGQKYFHRQCRLWTAKEVETLLQQVGFTVVKTRFYAPSPLPDQTFLRRFLRKARLAASSLTNFYLLGNGIFIVAKKG